MHTRIRGNDIGTYIVSEIALASHPHTFFFYLIYHSTPNPFVHLFYLFFDIVAIASYYDMAP